MSLFRQGIRWLPSASRRNNRRRHEDAARCYAIGPMRSRTLLHIVAATAIMVVSIVPTMTAQRGGRGGAAQAPAGPAPKLADGKPDLSGHWANPYTPDMGAGRAGGPLDPKTRKPLNFPH